MIYHIYANRSNVGDWLSAKGIQKLLHPLPITECLCDTPFVEETMDVLTKATEKDLIVIGGGGLLMNYFVPFWQAFESVANRVPFVVWGIGCCDLKNEATLPPRTLIERVIKKSRLCIVRDELTRKFLRALDLPAAVQCPSINYIEHASRGNGILHVNNYTTVGPQAYETMCSEGLKFSEDRSIVYRETNNRIDKESDLPNVLIRYVQSKFVISSALHGCIIAVAMGLKIIAVSGDRKIDEFMAAIGLEDWTLDVGDVAKVSELLNKLHFQKSRRSTVDQIRRTNEKIAKSVKSVYTDVVGGVQVQLQ